MEQQTLANHISKLGKHDFDIVCQIILCDIFGKKAINIDGTNDGGTDMTSFNQNASQEKIAYQITTQKKGVESKLVNDGKRAIEKLSVTKYFFFSTYQLDNIRRIKKAQDFSDKLGIPVEWFSADVIAGLLISEPYALRKFIDAEWDAVNIGYRPNIGYDIQERALYSYTAMSNDANNLKISIYDETIFISLYENGALTDIQLIQKVLETLALDEDKCDVLKSRIDALFGKSELLRTQDKLISLSEKNTKDIEYRQKLYVLELNNLVSSQVDLMRTDYQIDWTIEDSRKVALWIANAFVSDKLKMLKEVKVSIVNNPLLKVEDKSFDKIIEFLSKKKKIDPIKSSEIANKLIELASNHPLIVKLSRASVAIALQGNSPIASAKAIGVNRWSDVNIMLEPTIAIPYICTCLFQGEVNRFFRVCSRVIERAKKLDTRLCIPFFYINECAGHLIEARKYDGILLDENELQYSKNAYVANYYALKKQGVQLPATFMEYLRIFSPSIMTERNNISEWARIIMNDIQEKLTQNGIFYIDVPRFEDEDCKDLQNEYSIYWKKRIN